MAIKWDLAPNEMPTDNKPVINWEGPTPPQQQAITRKDRIVAIGQTEEWKNADPAQKRGMMAGLLEDEGMEGMVAANERLTAPEPEPPLARWTRAGLKYGGAAVGGVGGAFLGAVESVPTLGAAAPLTVPLMTGIGASVGYEGGKMYGDALLGPAPVINKNLFGGPTDERVFKGSSDLLEHGAEMIYNAPTSAANLAEGALAFPGQIAGGVGKIFTEGSTEALDETSKEFGAFIGDRVGLNGVEKFKDALVLDPIGTAAVWKGGYELGKGGVKKGAEWNRQRKIWSPEKLDKFIEDSFNKGVNPSSAKKNSFSQQARYGKDAVSAVKTITELNDKELLTFDDGIGGREARLPRTRMELSEAIAQSKEIMFKQYDSLKKQAGEAGVTLETSVLEKELRTVQESKVEALMRPEVVRSVERTLEKLNEFDNKVSVQDATEIIRVANESFDAYAKNPNTDTRTKAAVDTLIANHFRKMMEDSITNEVGPGWQAFRNKYKELSVVERDATKAALVDSKRLAISLLDFTDMFSAAEVVSGVLTHNPVLAAKGGTIFAVKQWYKRMKDRNRFVDGMFKRTDQAWQRNKKAVEENSTPAGLPPDTAPVSAEGTGNPTPTMPPEQAVTRPDAATRRAAAEQGFVDPTTARKVAATKKFMTDKGYTPEMVRSAIVKIKEAAKKDGVAKVAAGLGVSTAVLTQFLQADEAEQDRMLQMPVMAAMVASPFFLKTKEIMENAPQSFKGTPEVKLKGREARTIRDKQGNVIKELPAQEGKTVPGKDAGTVMIEYLESKGVTKTEITDLQLDKLAESTRGKVAKVYEPVLEPSIEKKINEYYVDLREAIRAKDRKEASLLSEKIDGLYEIGFKKGRVDTIPIGDVVALKADLAKANGLYENGLITKLEMETMKHRAKYIETADPLAAITKQEILDVVESNGYEATDVLFGRNNIKVPQKLLDAEKEAVIAYDEAYSKIENALEKSDISRRNIDLIMQNLEIPGSLWLADGIRNEISQAMSKETFFELVSGVTTKLDASIRAKQAVEEAGASKGQPAYQAYKKYGGKDFFELFVTAEKGPKGMSGEPRYSWKDGHAEYDGVNNPIVRLRMSDFMADGKKYLHIDEMQGPLGGKKYILVDNLIGERRGNTRYDSKAAAERDIKEKDLPNFIVKEEWGGNSAKMPKSLRDRQYDIGAKRALAYARENGYDGISWSTGSEIVSRYENALREVADDIRFDPAAKTLEVRYNGALVKSVDNIVASDLSSYVGKETAKNMLEKTEATPGNSTGNTYSKGFDIAELLEESSVDAVFEVTSMNTRAYRFIGDMLEYVDGNMSGNNMTVRFNNKVRNMKKNGTWDSFLSDFMEKKSFMEKTTTDPNAPQIHRVSGKDIVMDKNWPGKLYGNFKKEGGKALQDFDMGATIPTKLRKHGKGTAHIAEIEIGGVLTSKEGVRVRKYDQPATTVGKNTPQSFPLYEGVTGVGQMIMDQVKKEGGGRKGATAVAAKLGVPVGLLTAYMLADDKKKATMLKANPKLGG